MTRSFAVFAAAAVAVLIAALSGIASAWGAPFGAPHPESGLAASRLMGWIFAEQAALYRSLSGFLRASRDDGAAMWELFGICFVYGVFHAVGPGHGKAVISSYVVANEETWRRGVVLSFASAGLQSVVAVAVVSISAVLLGATAKAIGLTVHLVEVVSYGLVIVIGLRLLHVKGRGFLRASRELSWRRTPDLVFAPALAGKGPAATAARLSPAPIGATALRTRRCQVAGCDGHTDGFHCDGDHDHHESAWGHAHGPEPATLAGAGGWRRGLAAIVAVGLRPCSGAIIVLIFALSQDLLWTGVGATLVMGLGTALTVAAIATAAVGAREVASRVAKSPAGFGMLVMRAIEVGAAALIIAFGVLLLAGYMASERLWMFTG